MGRGSVTHFEQVQSRAGTQIVYLIQGLDPADIGSIVLGAGDSAVTLKREGGRFVVVNKDNYPADAKEINNLLTKCLEIRTSEFITDNPANHEDLASDGTKGPQCG